MSYGLYIHIPYCKSRCRYCDFYTQPASQAVPEAYIAALLRDFERYAPRTPQGLPQQPGTVYFGGGTPGLLAPAQVERILQAVQPHPLAEITLEANPEGVNEEKLQGWRLAGVNRLSFGVQTAREETLRVLGRLHTNRDVRYALQAAHKAGFENCCADIMLALPGYSYSEFDETFALVQEGGVTHISAYMLKVEGGTAFGKNPPPGLPDDDAAADFYLYAVQKLENAGYMQYEISNFARAGYQGVHNSLYWDGQNWLGLGPAAHSHLEGRRFSFDRDTATFINGTLQPQYEGALAAEEYIMLRLRLRQGLDEDALKARFGLELTAKQHNLLNALCKQQLAQKTAKGYALTAQGLLVQNAVLGALLGEG